MSRQERFYGDYSTKLNALDNVFQKSHEYFHNLTTVVMNEFHNCDS